MDYVNRTGHHIPVREADGWRPRRPQALLRPRLGPGLAAEARAAGEPPPAAGTVQYSTAQYSTVQYTMSHPVLQLDSFPRPVQGQPGDFSAALSLYTEELAR